MDRGKNTCVVFLDLSKAFDYLDHKLILLRKLTYHVVRGKQKSFLNLIQIIVSTALKQIPNFHKIECGFLQGSVIDPLLLLIYANYLPCASSFQITLLADDTNLHFSHESIETLQINVQNEVHKVDVYAVSHGMESFSSPTSLLLHCSRYKQMPCTGTGAMLSSPIVCLRLACNKILQ